MKKLILYTDGGSRGNPGPAGVGVFITDEKGNKMNGFSKAIGTRTNNEAEYEAVILALQKVKHLYGKDKVKNFEIEFRLDSQLIARQLGGKYKMEAEHLWPLFMKIWNLRVELGLSGEKMKFVEIPREKNKEADALANEAMDEAMGIKKGTKGLF